MKDNNFNNQAQDLILQPSQALIDNWKLWMAQEIVNQLKTRTSVKANFEKIATLFKLSNLDDFDNIWDTFKNCFKEIKQKSSLINSYSILKQKLDREFSKIVINKFKNISTLLENKYCDRLEQYIADDLQKASPGNVISFLKDVSKLLLFQRRNLEDNKCVLAQKIKSVNKACINLSSLKNLKYEQQNIWNAFNLLFQFKFEKERDLVLSKLILKLLQIAQTYYNSAQRSFLLLTNVEKSLKSKCSIKLISIPIFMYFKTINLNYQQLLIDLWIGHNINYWGNSSVTIEEFEQKLLENINDISQSLFYEFQLSFLENSIIKEK